MNDDKAKKLRRKQVHKEYRQKYNVGWWEDHFAEGFWTTLRYKVEDRRKRALHQHDYPDCVDPTLTFQSHSRHGICVECGKVTHERSIRTDEHGRRKYKPVCSGCNLTTGDWRAERTGRDWSRLTDPIRDDLIEPDLLPEQYPSHVRAALRAFEASGSDHAVVPSTTAGTLTQSIINLGLQDEMYAEQRGREAVVRRIEKS